MSDIVLFVGLIFFVGMLFIAIRLYELRNECRHTWERWIQSETEYAYVQQRLCSKCGVAETRQFGKIGKEKSENS